MQLGPGASTFVDTTRISLLLRLRNSGDAKAWSQFDAIYRPMLYRFATVRGLEHAAAEDIVQHCMLAVSEHIKGFEYDPTRGRFKGWLRTLVNNKVRNVMRDRRDQIAKTQDFNIADAREDAPDELFERVWMDEHLKHALRNVRDDVEPTTFAAFQQYVIEERPIEEVCASCGMNPNQVHAIKWRVTKKLRAAMAELTGEEES